MMGWQLDSFEKSYKFKCENGISLNVMSKAYGLPGLRIGWIASQDLQLLDKMEKMKHYLSICNSSPSEFLAWWILTKYEYSRTASS